MEVLRASAGRTVGRPEPGEDVVTFFELAEDATLQPAGDKAVAPAAAGTGGTGGTNYVCDLDDSGRATLELVTRSAAADKRAGGPPGGLLLLLLHPSDDARNAAVLAPLAEARAAVAARCWGLTVLRPSSCWSAGWRAALALAAAPAQPTHSDLVALLHHAQVTLTLP